MFKIILALSFATIFYECSPIRKDLLSKRSDSCSELEACSSPLRRVLSPDVRALSALSNETAYALVCQLFQTFKKCSEDSNSQCNQQFILEIHESKVAVADIICTFEGKEAIVAYNKSECATKNVMRMEAEELVNACHKKYNTDFCPKVEELRNCVLHGVTGKCGEEFASFFSQVWQTVWKPFLENNGCFFPIDNITVFNIGLDLDFNITKSGRWYYLVLRLQNNKKTHRHCKIDGGRSDILIGVRHVDFGPLPKCNKINSDSLHQCYGNMSLVLRDKKECDYSWQHPFTYKYIGCKALDVDIDVHMSTGFVWMELREGGSDINLNCSGSNSYNDETSYWPTSDSGQFDYIYTIIILASVAFLALLIAIVSIAFCVWRRRERKRNSNYDVPSKTQQDNHPYSVPFGVTAEVPHASHPTDHLEVIHFDYDYLEPTVVNNQEKEIMYEEIGI